jgi:stearoyl-CoA desaturase (delta-9 desaturase)
MSPNFAARWFELDPTWQIMRLLAWIGLIQISTPQRAVWPSVPLMVPNAADQ